MNLSNMKKMNDKPLRRVQGFKGDGASYIENNNLDKTQDFTIAMKIRMPQPKPNTGDSLVDRQSFFGMNNKVQGGYDNNLCFCMQYADNSGLIEYRTQSYNDGSNYSGVSFDSTPYIGEIVNMVLSTRNGYNSIMINGNIIESSVQSFLSSVLNDVNYLYGADDNTTDGGIIRYLEDTILEILEIQDTLTDTQLLEFANLARFTDHSDYATFNKNAYYPLDYNTKDYSSNSNDGTVTGTEQYEIVERGIKSINGAEVLSKKGFKGDNAPYITLANNLSNLTQNQCTVMWWQKLEDVATDPWSTSISNLNNPSDMGFVFRAIYWDSEGYYAINFLEEYSITNAQINFIINDEFSLLDLHHICFVVDSLNFQNSKLYVDGNEYLPQTKTTPAGVRQVGVTSWIGRIESGGSDTQQYLNGVLSDVKIFDSILTEAQIKEEMKGNILPALGYWPLQEDTKDYSNNSNNGTVTGTEQYETVQNGLTDWKDPVLP